MTTTTKKIELLSRHLPPNERNFQIVTTILDGNELLKQIGPQLYGSNHMHYFLLYDPYDASIDWEALLPFFRNWGEVMINHMVSDPARSIKIAKRNTTKEKYENTYLEDFENLMPYGSNKKAYEARVEKIINSLKGNRRYYVAAFPFYNTQNSHIYNLLHCTSSIKGFKLYKTSAWKVFGAQYSTKRSVENRQLSFDFFDENTDVETETCFHVFDIAKYLHRSFRVRQLVPLTEMWVFFESYPIFPSECFRSEVDWRYNRALLFLDSYATQVNWTTLENVAKTRSIDVWYLFPFSSLERMLPKNGKYKKWEDCIDRLLGDSGWCEEFYKKDMQMSMFDMFPDESGKNDEEQLVKDANPEHIQSYILSRLEMIFPCVSKYRAFSEIVKILLSSYSVLQFPMRVQWRRDSL